MSDSDHSDGESAGIAFDNVVGSGAVFEGERDLPAVLYPAPGAEVVVSLCCDESLAACRRLRRDLQISIYRIQLRLFVLKLKLQAVNLVRKVLRHIICRK